MKIFRYFSLLSCDFSSKNYQSQTSIQQNSTGKLEITDERFRLSRIEMLKIFENTQFIMGTKGFEITLPI